jgi:hypothetical protein
MSPAHLQSLYPKLPEFRAILEQYDPNRGFRKQFLEANLCKS